MGSPVASPPAALPTVEQLLIEAAIQRPEVEALIGSFGSITYSDLLIRAQNIAVALRRHKVGPGQMVGVAMDQSPVMITSIVGVLLAGAAYVPLSRDLMQHTAFLQRMRESGLNLVLCDRLYGAGSCVRWSEFFAVLDASRLEQQTMPTSDETGMPPTTPDSPAAVLFRRLPGEDIAGVVIPHRAIARLVLSDSLVHFHSTETFLLHPAATRRSSLLEIWGSLLHGATLALAPDAPVRASGGMLTADRLALAIRQFNVSALCLPVAALHDLIDNKPEIFSRLNNLVIELEHDGEVSALSPQRLQWLANNHPRLRIVNTYGTIETSGYAASFHVPSRYAAQASVPIGKPVDGMQAVILDRELFPSREGEIGELAFAGDGVVDGYWNDPDMTAGRFLRRVQPGSNGDTRMFLTGERARWRSDGLLELHGRSAKHTAFSTAQPEFSPTVKPRLHAFGPADVEAMLIGRQGIRDAAVVEQLDESGSRRQIAFVAFEPARQEPGRVLANGSTGSRDEKTAQEAFEEAVRSTLPPAAMPHNFRYVESIPRNVHGEPDQDLLQQQWAIETDRAQLQHRRDAQQQASEQRSKEMLNQVRTIWLRLLQRVSVGCDEDFLDAGGTPVQMIRMHVELNRLFPGAITMANLSVLSTIRRIHQHLMNYLSEAPPSLNRRGA